MDVGTGEELLGGHQADLSIDEEFIGSAGGRGAAQSNLIKL
jgi:hypothetical protein